MQVTLNKECVLFAAYVLFILCSQSKADLREQTSHDEPVTSHPCYRPCIDGEEPRECHYNFTLEVYQTLSRACFNCPKNKTDCLRPHCVQADGIERGIFTINRQMPGPSIQVCENDVIVVNVANRIQGHGASIHWHGIHQRGTPYMDGVPMVTQCPIASFTRFQYRFPADTRGTHLYHAHSAMERSDGIFGSLVVRQPPSRDPNSALYDFDLEDHVILLTDWTHDFMMTRYAGAHHAGLDDYPDSMLINGRGTYKDLETEERTTVPYSKFTVASGKKYRFRVASAGSLDCPVLFYVDDHRLLVIATDGSPVRPLPVRTLVIFPGERYDVVIETNRTVSSYWIRVMGLTDCQDQQCHQVAILEYEGSTATQPRGQGPRYDPVVIDDKYLNPLNENCVHGDNAICVIELQGLDEMDPALRLQNMDYQFYMGFDMNTLDNFNFYDMDLYPNYLVTESKRMQTPQVNNVSFIFPSSPPLTQWDDLDAEKICNHESRLQSCKEHPHFCECVHVLEIPFNSTVEFVLVDEGQGGDESHPFHLHGYNFHVVGMGRIAEGSSMTWLPVAEVKAMDQRGELSRNLEMTSPKKDTVSVPNKGYTIIRFRADNPGTWLFHCHVVFHSTLGMSFIVRVGNVSHLPPVPESFPRCGDWVPDRHRGQRATSAASRIRSFF